MRTLTLALCLLLSGSTLLWGETNSRWTIQSPPQISSHNKTTIVSISINDNKAHASFPISATTVLESVTDAFVSADKLVLLGDAGRTQAVQIFDLQSKQLLDWFFCYEPQHVDTSLLAFVEYYPSHSSAITTDVVLLYDLEKTPRENRLVPVPKLPPGRNDYPVAVGFPIFPEYNVQNRTYDNTVEEEGDVNDVLGPPFFLMLSSNRLVFVVHKGAGDSLKSALVNVDLSRGLSNVKETLIAIPNNTNSSGKAERIAIDHITEVNPFAVRLHLARAETTEDSILIEIPK